VPANLGMIIDVVDKENRVISRTERRAVLTDGLNFRTVHVLLFDENDNLVLQRLSPHHPRSPNRLGSSVAGYLYAQETYFAAAKRKLREELRVTARIQNIGQLEMPDEMSRKFVGVFIGRLRQKPMIADDLIAELVYLTAPRLDSLVNDSPSAFTPTFLFVYDHFKRWARTH
jgi:isopentenyldiphosphate isomerase